MCARPGARWYQAGVNLTPPAEAAVPACHGLPSVHAVAKTAQPDKLEPEGLDAVERAVQRGLVHVTDQYGVRPVRFDPEVAEGLTAGHTDSTQDGDPIAVRAHVGSRRDTADQQENYRARDLSSYPISEH